MTITMIHMDQPAVVIVDDGMLPKLQALKASVSTDDATDCTASISQSSSITSTSESVISFAPQNPRIHSFLERTWKLVKQDLLQIVGAEDEETTILLFRSLHKAGLSNDILKSMALLSTTMELPDDVREQCIERFALYLASTNHSYHTKLGCVRTLIVLTSPIDASWQLEEGCLKETLEFLMVRQQDWLFPEHSESLLLWELRAKCLRFSELSEQNYRIEVEDVVKGGELAAAYIAGSAKWVERGLKWSVPVINCGLESAGDKLKEIIVPQEQSRNAKVVANCTRAAKEATDEVRITAKRTANNILDASTVGMHMAAKKIEYEKYSLKLVPDQDHRDVLAAAGKVGVASLGASIIVGEAIFETTKAVAQKTASVTADVVRHTYGDSAGQIIQDTSDTTGNILRTIGHVAMLEARVLTKSVLKNTGKVQFDINHEEEEGKEDNLYPMLMMLDSTKVNAQAVIEKLNGIKRKAILLDKGSATISRV